MVNPKNGKKYSVTFVLFKGDRLVILSYKTSLQMNLVQIKDENFDIATLTTSIYPGVFDGKLGSLPSNQKLRITSN